MTGYLLILRDHAQRPRFTWHASGNLNELDRRRFIAKLPVREQHAGLTLDGLVAVMAHEILKELTAAGIRSDGTLPPPRD